MRLARGLSQQELAARTDISPSYLSLLESGRKEPSLAMIRAIAQALRIPEDLIILSSVDYGQLRVGSPETLAAVADQLLALIVPNEVLTSGGRKK